MRLGGNRHVNPNRHSRDQRIVSHINRVNPAGRYRQTSTHAMIKGSFHIEDAPWEWLSAMRGTRGGKTRSPGLLLSPTSPSNDEADCRWIVGVDGVP